jgi:hypothetical protein
MKNEAGRNVFKIGFTKSETVEALGISRPTIDRLVRCGLLKPSRATRRPIFSREELERFLRDTTGRRGDASEGARDAQNGHGKRSVGGNGCKAQAVQPSGVEGS